MYDEQLKLTGFSIKINYLKQLKNLKDLKFKNLRVELNKNDKVFKKKVFKGTWYNSEKKDLMT